jgi:hypothetical protein
MGKTLDEGSLLNDVNEQTSLFFSMNPRFGDEEYMIELKKHDAMSAFT